MSDNFCVIPWIHMASKPIGTARICCLMSNSHSTGQGVISDDTGRPYNLGTDDFDEIKNGERVRQIRLSMLNNERPVDCNTCWVKEDMGASSRRLVTNRMYKDEFTRETALAHTDEQGYTTWQPSYWDLRFGNLCNLKCVMCHPASSNQWYEDFILLNGNTAFTDIDIKVNLNKIGTRYVDGGEYKWWDNAEFWEKMESKIPFLKQVYLVGGEPLMIEPHYDFLQKVIDSGRSRNVTLEYDTNLTNVQVRVIELWRHFKQVKLRVSLDDFGEQFNYVRFPGKWHSVSGNIQKLFAVENIKIDFTVTWQVVTSYTTVNLLRYLEQYNNSLVHIRILSNPTYFDVKILPPTVKQRLVEYYKQYQEAGGKYEVDHLINYLENNMAYINDGELTQCVNTLDKLDSIRKTDWKNTFLDLYTQLNKMEE